MPLHQGRPVWVDDPHFNLRYHLRHAGLPAPGSEEQLKNLAGRLFAQPLDRTKPLWELSLVDGLGTRSSRSSPRATTRSSTGSSRVDITRVLFDADPDAAPPAAPASTVGRAPPPHARPAALRRAARARDPAAASSPAPRAPSCAARATCCRARATGCRPRARWRSPGLEPAPPTPLNVKVGPHRRYTWVDAELAELRAIKDSLGGTVNDAILAVVAGALGRYLRHRGVDTRDLVLKALVPISVRAEDPEHGNVVAPLDAPLPVGIEDPVEQYRAIRDVGERARRHARGGRRAHADRARRASPRRRS